MNQQVRVLVVDDSALVRELLREGLSRDPEILVIGVAKDAYEARDKIVHLKPQVLTLDVEMPKMDGVAFLRKLMPQYPLPVVMVSSLTIKGKQVTIDALEAGAVDFVSKPTADVVRGLEGMIGQLCTKIKIAATANVSHWKHRRPPSSPKPTAIVQSLSETTDKVIAIGASTGGTEAIRELLLGLPRNCPGVVVVQHMPAGFTKVFAERMNTLCTLEVVEAQSGDRIMPGRVLIAPGGDNHLVVVRSGGQYRVSLVAGEKVLGHRPSVEVMMMSVAQAVGKNAVGVMLTGMGRDGADAMVKMRKAGARTLAQDEATSVVFGMPKEAWERGGAERLVALPDLPGQIIAMVNT